MKFIFKAIFNYIKNTDRWLIFFCITVSSFSVLLLMGLGKSELLLNPQRQIMVQGGAALVGLIIAIIMSKIDYKFMAKMWKLHSLLGYGLVLSTFVFGIRVSDFVDDRAWLRLPMGLTLQPSELLKISFIVTFALHLQKVDSQINKPKQLLGLILHAGLPIGLVMLQGDHGTALIFAFIFACMIFAAGLSYKYIAAAFAMVAIAAPTIWYKVLSDDKKMRILTVFNPELDPQGIGWQQHMGILAIGSGQKWGKGLFIGQHNPTPMALNDFIFSFIGEALGFVGCLFTVGLLALIVIKILLVIPVSKDNLGKYICVGVFAMFAVQILLNIGMCISVLPVIGITLPFISAGGTSIVASYLGIGLVLSVYMNNKTTMFSDK